MKLKLQIIDLDGVYFDSEVDLLNIKTASGELTILANHLPLITSIEISNMYIKNDEVIKRFSIAGGTLFVTDTDCKVLTSAIESEEEIDIARAERALKRAQERMEREGEVDTKRAEVALKRATNRLRLIK